MSDYVTVVSVDLNHHQQPSVNGSAHTSLGEKQHPPPSSFVTVLSINGSQSNTTTISTGAATENAHTDGEIVTVYRLPGERLGFGLKFQGGTKTNERVERLFIQSCDANTPASRARTSWGKTLSEGDEILEIDHEPVTNMTRIECVKCLKDKNVAINLLVRKGDRDSMNLVRSDATPTKRPLPPPPPKIPPRKIHKKPPPPPAPVVASQPPPPPPLITETPVAAEMYLNTLDDEMSRNDESDETGSTISSQISVISNFSSESDLSLLSNNNSDLTRILTKPFQMIEREFNVSGSGGVVVPMSIDNLLLFNDSEPLPPPASADANVDDEKAMSNYVNVAMQAPAAIEYENVDFKVPPVPRPRVSISMPQEAGEAHTTTIESWLNDAKAVNGSATAAGAADKSSATLPRAPADAQNYEAIKFECFAAAADDDDDGMEDGEKLGPPELLNISEAYFNFPWCGNASGNLPTIGEAEEEFSSMEHFTNNTQRVVVNGPIFIVHDESKSGVASEAVCHQRENMEINNNEKSPYLREREDKGDNLMPAVQCASDGDTRAAKSDVRGCAKGVCSSVDEARASGTIKSVRGDSDRGMNSKSDNDECAALLLNERTNELDEERRMAFNREECAESAINYGALIKSDSARLDAKEISAADQNTLIASRDDESDGAGETKQSQNADDDDEETETDREETATITLAPVASDVSSTPSSPPIVERSSFAKMDQKQMPSSEHDRVDAENSTDAFELAMRRAASSRATRSDSSSIDTANKFSSSTTTTPKATAIVAPQRKAHQFEEITNFVDTKPPFKSATLGRQRPQFNYRNKDEKSERSVRDKIAMFSNSTSDISHILPKTPTTAAATTTTPTTAKDKLTTLRSIAKSTENIFSAGGGDSAAKLKVNGRDFVMKKKAMSVENLDDYDDDENEIYGSKTLSYTPVSKPVSLHSPARFTFSRAQSVDHLNCPALPTSRPPSSAPLSAQLSRHISFNGYASDNGSSRRSDDGSSKLAHMLESRKKHISKLRGLVIPERVPESDADQKVLGLPVIRSKECELIDTIKSASSSPSLPVRKTFVLKPAPRMSVEDERAKVSPPIKPPRTSLIFSSPKSSQSNSLTTATDESDTESCVSSPVSPVAKKPLIRTLSSNSSLSSNSTLTSGSGSQASCSSNASPETRKSSTETNASSRKSIVASAKSRSGRECLDKSWRDEDSTDGGIDEERQRAPKAKARNSLTNYKLVNHGDNLVDKVINVATYVEVMSSDSEEKIETSESMSKVTTQKTVTVTKADTPALTDMAKWVRKEVSKTTTTTEIVKKVNKTEEIRKLPKSLDPPKKLNFSEIRKNFESKQVNGVATSPAPRTPARHEHKTPSSAPPVTTTFNHNRFSSWDSVASSSSGVSSELLGTGTGTNNSESLQTIQSDFGSFSSFGSSHSLITPQDLQSIIDEADPPLETSEAFVVVLHRETPESSIGITLAGGSDYEAKEITIHRILTNSPADKDGRLKKGDRLLSINGLSMRGLTHRESLSVLKSPRTDVVMVVTRSKSVVKTNSLTKTKLGSLGSLSSLSERADVLDTDLRKSLHASRSVDTDLDAISNDDCNYRNKEMTNGAKSTDKSPKASDIVSIIKDGTGIGISLEGGFDSPAGNKPLVIKKIFMGGAAEKLSNLKAGDEILEINGLPTEKQTRIDVWNMIKRLPQGEAVQLKIKRC